MRAFILVSMVIITTQIFTQEFAPIGSIWHYTQWTIDPDVVSFKTIETISDTVINGNQCRKMVEVERYLDTVNVTFHYMYSENDSVFFFADNDFQLLYDFGANTGDTIILGYFTTYNGSPLQMIIDSTDAIMVNNEERKIQYITCGDGLVIEFGEHVIEGIGNTSFMFPTLDGSINGPLRCYEDNITGFFLNPFNTGGGWNQQDCDQIITDIAEINPKYRITLYPNPTSGKIFVKGIDKKTEYRIIDCCGNIIKTGNIEITNEISLTDMPRGFYLLELKNENLLTTKKIFKE